MIAPLLIILVGTALAVAAARSLTRTEFRYAMIAFGLHILSAFGQAAVPESYGGDVDVYMDVGGSLARLLDYDFMKFFPEVLKLILHYEAALPFEVFGAGGATGTM